MPFNLTSVCVNWTVGTCHMTAHQNVNLLYSSVINFDDTRAGFHNVCNPLNQIFCFISDILNKFCSAVDQTTCC